MSEIKHVYPKNPRTKPSMGSPGKRSVFKSSWTLEVIDAPGAWLIPMSAEQTVCLIDVDFNFDHQDLVGAIVDKPAIIEMDTGKSEKGKEGHGTRVAGVIAAAHDTGYGRAGVCPGAHILAFHAGRIPVWDKSLAPYGIAFDTIAGRMGDAIKIICETFNTSEHRVLNISQALKCGREMAENLARKYLLTQVDAFLDRGGVLVVGGDNAMKNSVVLTADCFPAALKQISSKPTNILVVSSVLVPTSQLWGGELDPLYSGQNDVDVYAPGSEQEVLDYQNPRGYVTDSGNSLALPHVAGVAAHLFRINSALDGEKVANTILETAELQSTQNVGEPIRVVNAFAAALKVYNEAHPEQALAGYRVILPIEFNEGTLWVNGEPVSVVHIDKLNHSFCRFTAPKGLDIHARLFKHASLDTRCYWEGRFQDLLDCALPGSRESAWTHPAVAELHTVRLQGLALSVEYGGPAPEVVRNARLTLKDRRRSSQWSTRTDELGGFLLPFGEPGPYILIVEEDKEGGARYEIDLKLEANTFYTEDPNHPGNSRIVLGTPVSSNRWLESFAGTVVFEGTARRKENRLLGAKGMIRLKASANSITPEILMDHCYETLTGDEDCFEDALDARNEESEESLTAEAYILELQDMMPDLADLHKKSEIRGFSSFHRDLAHGFDSERQTESRFEPEEWYKGQELPPPGYLLAEGAGNCEVALDFQQITQRVLESHFRVPSCGVTCPYTVDVEFYFYADHSKNQGEGNRFCLTRDDDICHGEITVAEVPCVLDRDQSNANPRIRIVAGPCENALRFVKHPESPLQIEPDPESPPTGCISAIVTLPASSGEVPGHLLELFVVGAQGEIGQVFVA